MSNEKDADRNSDELVCSTAPTKKQRQLARKHGTPSEFRDAVMLAVPGFISVDEASRAIERYEQEWKAAGKE